MLQHRHETSLLQDTGFPLCVTNPPLHQGNTVTLEKLLLNLLKSHFNFSSTSEHILPQSRFCFPSLTLRMFYEGVSFQPTGRTITATNNWTYEYARIVDMQRSKILPRGWVEGDQATINHIYKKCKTAAPKQLYCGILWMQHVCTHKQRSIHSIIDWYHNI